MDKPDYLAIDGRQLRILLTIQRAGSLSGAAKMLDMNQSTVSYWLDLLRKRTGDPLFVRAGNGVEPTARAQALFPAAQAALRHVEAMFEPQTYDPAEDRGAFRIAGTAVERRWLFAPLLRHVLEVAPGLTLELQPSGSPSQVIERLRDGTVDAAVLPADAAQGDGIQRRTLIRLRDAVYFDPAFPLAPGDWDGFCARPQARVAFGPDAGFGVDRRLAKVNRTRHTAAQVADFDSALALIPGTPLIATLPDHLEAPGLARIAPPWDQDGLDMALYWHVRHQGSARHGFWRDALAGIAKR